MTCAEPEATFLTPGLVALRLGVCDGRVDRLLRSGRVPYVLAGRVRLVRVEDLDRVREALGLAARPAVAHAG